LTSNLGNLMQLEFEKITGLSIDLGAGEFSGCFDKGRGDYQVPTAEVLIKNATSNGTNSPLIQACAASTLASLWMGATISGTTDITLTHNPDKFLQRGGCSAGADIPVGDAERKKTTADLAFFNKRLSGATCRAAFQVFSPSPQTLTVLGCLDDDSGSSDDSGAGGGKGVKRKAKDGSSSDESDVDDSDDSNDGDDASAPGLVTHTHKHNTGVP
jgi:hypothetical protein